MEALNKRDLEIEKKGESMVEDGTNGHRLDILEEERQIESNVERFFSKSFNSEDIIIHENHIISENQSSLLPLQGLETLNPQHLLQSQTEYKKPRHCKSPLNMLNTRSQKDNISNSPYFPSRNNSPNDLRQNDIQKEPSQSRFSSVVTLNPICSHQALPSKSHAEPAETVKLRELHERELQTKTKIFNENLSHLLKTQAEEVKRLRLDYEARLEQAIKSHQEEKRQLEDVIAMLEEENEELIRKPNHKRLLVDFQRKYLDEMQQLRKAFKEFRDNASKEFKILRCQRDSALEQLGELQKRISTDGLGNDAEQAGTKLRQLERALSLARIDLENARNEVNFLQMRLAKMEATERKLKLLLVEKDYITEKAAIVQSTRKKHSNITEVYDDRSQNFLSDNENVFHTVRENFRRLRSERDDWDLEDNRSKL